MITQHKPFAVADEGLHLLRAFGDDVAGALIAVQLPRLNRHPFAAPFGVGNIGISGHVQCRAWLEIESNAVIWVRQHRGNVDTFGRQRHQPRRPTTSPSPIMHRPLHRPLAWADEGDVAALDHDLTLACGQRDAVAGLDAHFVGGALHREVFVGPHLLGVGVGAQAQGAVGGDAVDAAGMGVEAGGLAADAAQGVGTGEVRVAVRGQAGVLAAEQADAGRGHEGGGAGGVQVQQGLGKFFNRVAQGAALGFLGRLPVHGAGVPALGLGVDGLGVLLQGLGGVVAAQALGALLGGALAQGVAQLVGGLELGHRLGGVHLGALHAGALRVARGAAEQQALPGAHHGPAFGVAVEAFAQPLATLGVA